MNGETGFWHSFGVWSVAVCRSVEESEGSSPLAHLRATDFGKDHLILTMMRSCASAAKLRAAGPFYRSALTARFEYGFPPPRIVNSAVC